LERKKLGFILVFSAGVCWGSAGVLGKILMNNGLQPETVAMYRLTIGFLALTLVFLLLNPTVLRVKPRKIPCLSVAGVVGVAGGILAYFYAVKLISASVAVLLLYAYPIFTLMLARFFVGEKPTLTKVFAVMFVVVGCFFVVKGYSLTYLKLTGLGVAVGLASALAYSIYMILSKVMLKDVEEPTIIVYTLGFGALTLTLVNLFFNGIFIPHGIQTWILIFLIAFIPTTAAFTFFIFGLKNVEAGRASIYSTSEIISALVLAFLFLGERLEPLQMVGAAIIFLSIITMYWREKRFS